MIKIRKSEDRGHFQSDWLDSYHTFSFDTYQDPGHMGFRTLRVINQDRVKGGHGFPLHPHRDMEIISLILQGSLEHRDSLGNREIIGAGELQRITAGTGIRHSEQNPSPTEEVHFLQIWILPERPGLEPTYEIKGFAGAVKSGELLLIGSRDGRDHSARIHQDVDLFLGRLEPDQQLSYGLSPGRHAWLQMIRGVLDINGTVLEAGDGAALSDHQKLQLTAGEKADFLLFDLN